jgi:hypothetical protein
LTLVLPAQGRAACDCSASGGYAWLANTKIRFNNDASIVGNVGVNLPGGLARFGRNSCQGTNPANPCVGNSVAVSADKIVIGELSSVAGTESNVLRLGFGAVVRNPPLLTVSLPLVSNDPASVCGAFTDIACGGMSLSIPDGANAVIAPGVYNALMVGSGATITMGAGSYSFCSVKIGNGVVGTVDENAVVNVAGKFSMGSGSILSSTGSPFVLNSEGSLVRLSQNAVLEAEVRAPFGKIKMQRASTIRGCSCSNTLISDKGHSNVCASPSGAFVD